MLGVYRIVDANLNRAKEGLRVVEDICRFVLDDALLTDQVKNVRHNLTKLNSLSEYNLLVSRESTADVGRARSVPTRKSLSQTFIANVKRATEAIRVLEEVLPNGDDFKEERYTLYDLEKAVAIKLRLKLPFERDVYVVHHDSAVLKQAVRDGAAIVQLRNKQLSEEQLYPQALELAGFCQEQGAVFIINDYPNLAKRCGAAGVHIGQDDDVARVRDILGPDFIIGKSTHSLEQGLVAAKQDVNYVAVGPVYQTPTKPGRPAVGLQYVREATANIEKPLVTIGGIDLTNLNEVLQAGANCVGIVRAAPDTAAILAKVKSFN